MLKRFLNHWITKRIAGPIAVVVAIGYGWIQYNYPTCTFRYKITAEVETPDGVKTGSSVVDVSYAVYPNNAGGVINPNLSMSGEALYFDLGQNKNLIITLTTWASRHQLWRTRIEWFSDHTNKISKPLPPHFLPLQIFGVQWLPNQERKLCRDLKLTSSLPKFVPLENVPTMITFSDLNNPETVKVVTPEEVPTVFGPGFALKTYSIVGTQDAPVESIEKILRWLPSKKQQWERRPKGRGINVPLIDLLQFNAFKTPDKWGESQ